MFKYMHTYPKFHIEYKTDKMMTSAKCTYWNLQAEESYDMVKRKLYVVRYYAREETDKDT